MTDDKNRGLVRPEKDPDILVKRVNGTLDYCILFKGFQRRQSPQAVRATHAF